jgi:integrase
MPRPRKGARLWLRPERRDRSGRLVTRATWIILDEGGHIATGCAAREADAAERRLADYIARKYRPARRERDIDGIDVADVLSIYHDDRWARLANPKKFDERIGRLNEFWGGKMLADVTGASCREYVLWRGSSGGARRDLEDLRAAINHHARQGYHRGVVGVPLPEKGRPRDRWLTRDEAAQLLRTCWRTREVQRLHRGASAGERVETSRYPLRHLARFILIGLYTGTRASAIAAASPYRAEGRSFVDLERGIFYRLADGQRATNKRQPPVPVPPRLLAHLRRWARRGIADEHFVEWNGKPVKSVKTAFASAVKRAQLSGKVTPHTLRHTAATWLMQAGVDKWEAAGFLGMSVEMLDRVYGHHHPDHLKVAARAIGYRPRPRETLVISLGVPRPTLPKLPQPFEIIGGPGGTRTPNQTVMSGRL